LSDNKKYYYMKLKENFFDTDEMILLESMQDGFLYCNILLKLYLRSLKDDGRLMFKSVIPYTPDVLSKIVRHNVGVVEKAIQIFKQLGLVEILDNGAIFMMDIQNFIGESSTEADRIRLYRKKVEEEKKLLPPKVGKNVTNVRTNVQQMYDKSTPELEIDLDTDLDLKKDKRYADKTGPKGPTRTKFIHPNIEEVTQYCTERNNGVDPQKWFNHYTSNGWKVGKNPMKDWKAAVRTWERSEFAFNGGATNGTSSGNSGSIQQHTEPETDWNKFVYKGPA